MPTTAIFAIVQIALEHGPELAHQIADLFQRQHIDVSAWEEVFAAATGKSVDDYLAEARKKLKR